MPLWAKIYNVKVKRFYLFEFVTASYELNWT